MSVLTRHPARDHLIHIDSDAWVRRYRRKLFRQLFPQGYVVVVGKLATQVFPNPKRRNFRRRKR